MIGPALVDTGPLVALLNRRERHHSWAVEQFSLVTPPALTCEAVLSEAAFLLSKLHGGVDALMQLLTRGVIATPFALSEELDPVTKLLTRYGSIPMSLADACLVRMAEQYSKGTILTLDHHFRIYRKNGRLVIPVRMPG